MQQATSAHSATVTLASRTNAELFTPTRRAMLFGLASIPAVSVHAAPVTVNHRNEWDRLQAAYEEAEERSNDFQDEVYNPAWDKLKTLLGAAPPLDITVKVGEEFHSERVNPNFEYSDFPYFDRHRACQQAFHAWTDRSAALEKERWYAEASDKMDGLYASLDSARSALMDCPAPDALALAYKLRLALGNDELWENEKCALAADAERFCHFFQPA